MNGGHPDEAGESSLARKLRADPSADEDEQRHDDRRDEIKTCRPYSQRWNYAAKGLNQRISERVKKAAEGGRHPVAGNAYPRQQDAGEEGRYVDEQRPAHDLPKNAHHSSRTRAA